MTCCFTGHRHFSWGDDTESPHQKDLLAGLENAVDRALAEGVTHFICGNAVGVDTWAAEMVLQKKKSHPEIFLEIALPFAGHNADEPACQAVQRQADLVHTVGKSKYRKAAFSERQSIYGRPQRFSDCRIHGKPPAQRYGKNNGIRKKAGA